jgi:hypothetical protein
VPRPRVNLTRFHGVFAPYADLRIMPTLRRQPLLQVAIAAMESA